MVVAAALVSFGAGLLLGWVLCRRARRGADSSWQEWRDAANFSDPRYWPVSLAAGAATLIGICGFGVPGALRAALLGTVAGFSLPFAVEGVRRYRRARQVPAGQDG
jgi:hypothetical protein